jgi:transmembrane sensor
MMTSKDEQIRAAIAEQASEWFVANDDESLDTKNSAALVGWLKASPEHVEEFLGIAVIARDLREACADSEHSLDTLLAHAQADGDGSRPFWLRAFAAATDFSVRRWQIAAVTMAALGVAGLLFWNFRPIAPVSAPVTATALHFETRHGEQQTHRLADNSVLHLNTDTAVTVRYSKTERLVMLVSGQAAFEVTHQSQRPFRVVAGPAEVRDLGTQFDVRLDNGATVVTVVEGHVAVGLSRTSQGLGTSSDSVQRQRFVELSPDQQISVSQGAWPAVPAAVDAKSATAWLHRQIIFEHEPLERVAAEFNRYAAKPIEITTPKLRHLEISGVFTTDDNKAFIAFLRSLKGVRVDVTPTQVRVSQK